MAVYTHLTDASKVALAHLYDIGEITALEGIASGVENSNYLLRADKQGKEERYILTLYEKRVKPEELPYFLGLMAHLAAKGFACPEPLKGRNGQLVQTLQGKQAAIVTFLPGRECRSPQPAHLGALGRAMAEMHIKGADFPLKRDNDLSLPGWATILKKIAPRADEIEPGLAQLLTTELKFLIKNWPSNLPQGQIHADLFTDNVFYEGDHLTGVIDFYFACTDTLIYDLAICLNAWCFERHKEFNITKARALLNGYHTVRPISGSAELEALPILARGSALRFLLTRAHDWLFRVEGALVTPKDPTEYLRKLKFHQEVKSHTEYGL